MASEDDLEESGTSSPASSTSQVSQAARPGASENLRCPICRAPMNDQASASWRRHPFCFYCTVEWFHRRVDGLICQSLFQHAFHTVGDSNSEVQPIGESTSSASHTLGVRAGSRSAERCQHHSSGRQHRKSPSRSCGGSHGGSCRGSRGRAQGKSRSRCPRRHHDGRARAQQAQGSSHSSSRRRQSRAQNTARDKGQAPRTKRHVRALSRRRKRHQQEYQVSFIEPRAVRSRSRQRSRGSSSRTLREYLRKMERDEGRALRHDCYMRASSGRSRRQQQRQQVSYREPQVARSRTPRRFRSTMPLKENPRRMEYYERQPLRIEHALPRRSERLQQGRQVPFIKPQVTSQPRGRSRNTQHQTQQEDRRRMERDEGRAPRPEGDIPSSPEWSEHRQQGRRISFTEP
ncbi:PREDICTED: serine/arginine repetitive matrix protein 5-like [Ficedula albicollis]|uniref:serine/arginine repetitive matrix protein 5-like n=1 Tax=Ficedula albicollis TaxID=59894 RepID=UPI000359556B|nr:PREDICTED: serine/arginine repetitive matrix protein 5-like [Ficedula albicollis]